MDSRPIGVFDSGVGGLTVARAIIDQLPDESVLYIGDSANTPYGPKPIARVRELALDIMDRLVQSDVKMLVIACNSASAAVLHDARERYQVGHGIPVVEVIQPAVRRAVAATRNGRIGVIGTEATIGSGAYDDAFAAAPHLELTTAACPLTDVIEEQAQQALGLIADKVRIQWVWLPPWGPDKITPEGREQLRALGFNV